MKKIVLIGSGNVATNIGVALKKKGYKIMQVWSYSLKNAKILANKLDCNFTSSLSKLMHADLYIISIKDDNIIQLLENIPDIPIVHTSGGIGMDVFKKKFNTYGVFYPLQKFKKNIEIKFKNIPILIEANNNSFKDELINIANQLSKQVLSINSKEREQLHIAAVFASNFSNHMFSIAYDILKKSNLDFKLLLPIIKETINKLDNNNPSNLQTGPAKRKDKKVITSHLNNIENNDRKEIYKMISNAIIRENE